MDKLLNDLEPNFVRSENPGFNVPFKGRKRPDFYIDPKKSVVVQVKATEILYHENYALQYTLRFPRIVVVRRDKSWQDILTLKEFHEIRVTYGGKFAKRNNEVGSSRKVNYQPEKTPYKIPTSEREENSNKTSAQGASNQQASSSKYFTISKSYKTRSAKNVSATIDIDPKNAIKIQRNVFNSLVFCAIGSQDWKLSTEKEIILSGGEIVQNPTSDMFAIIAETLSVKVDKLIKKGQYDVLRSSWISKCLMSEKIEKIFPEDIFAVKPSTRAELDKDFDVFGDSYRNKNSSIETKKLLKRVMDEEKDNDCNDSGLDDSLEESSLPCRKRNLQELDPKDAAKIRKYNFLDECKIAIRGEIHPQDLFKYQHNVLFYGGHFAHDEGEVGVTHVLSWDQNSPTKQKQLSAFVVKPKWLLDCLASKKLLDELNYMSE
ncbi:unnamed protein product [Allacma fusca]|uniref:BRCT domain-containing protein n=1 Tax=Allacma fusca TaxID=39272 RepID=A0A8J2KVL5_9HEXA|nr:unnamed protein product [Allacma fusca]